MLKTIHKSQLPQHWSYPVGAEELARALATVPNLDTFRLNFSNGPSKPSVQSCYTSPNHHPLILAGYQRKTPNHWEGALLDQWSLTVYCVQSDIRKPLVVELLKTSGLQLVRDWLTAERDPIWYYGHRYFIVYFDSSRSELFIEEQPKP